VFAKFDAGSNAGSGHAFDEGNLMSNKLDFSKELIGRRALVTGGTRGIGAAIAQRLLDAGAKVVVTARSRGETLPAGAAFVAGDVAAVSGVKAVIKERAT
jgi:NADPH:quinone reductase-like Zn-dependent oxidoreductase